MSRFPRLGMAAASGRGRPSGPEPRAMSRAPEPAPAAAGQLRPAPRPSRTRGRSSREAEAPAAATLFRSQSPPGPGVTSSPDAYGFVRAAVARGPRRVSAGLAVAVCTFSEGFGGPERKPHACGSELSCQLGLPAFPAPPSSTPQAHFARGTCIAVLGLHLEPHRLSPCCSPWISNSLHSNFSFFFFF